MRLYTTSASSLLIFISVLGYCLGGYEDEYSLLPFLQSPETSLSLFEETQ